MTNMISYCAHHQKIGLCKFYGQGCGQVESSPAVVTLMILLLFCVELIGWSAPWILL